MEQASGNIFLSSLFIVYCCPWVLYSVGIVQLVKIDLDLHIVSSSSWFQVFLTEPKKLARPRQMEKVPMIHFCQLCLNKDE